jgi:hypothetical protein
MDEEPDRVAGGVELIGVWGGEVKKRGGFDVCVREWEGVL